MKKNKFSLILATYGRKEEIKDFIDSLLNSEYDLNLIELIIVDQNDVIDLTDIVLRYKNILNLKYIKSKVKGLSKNRNIGLKKATGEIVAFPDDDCEYLKETLKIVNEKFNENNYDLVLGRIVERDDTDSLRCWSKEKSKVTVKNFYKKCSSITVFLKKEVADINLNEKLGVGEYFGACEDADLIYRNCKKGLYVKYIPDVKVYHPHYNSDSNMSLKKIHSYGLGFGAMISANKDINMSILFIKAQAYHFIKMIISFLKLDFNSTKKSGIAFISRFRGLIEYKN